jgi:Uncharacterised conserved protein (DUF2228)
MSRLQQRRARLRAEYGFDFPDDFFAFWEFVNRLSPLAPLRALSDLLDITLVGPFEILAGRFDGRVPRHSLLLHWRYHDDPPEFFTVFAGGGDGLHFGYYLDDPDTADGCVASYYAEDVFELSADGDTLFEAVRLHLEYCHGDCLIDAEVNPEDAALAAESLQRLDELRQLLLSYATADRPEVGEDYTERYAGVTLREDRVMEETADGMGIVVDPYHFRPLSKCGRSLWKQLRKKKNDPAELVEEARRALIEGFPGTALALGKDLWATTVGDKMAHAIDLMDAAYEGLGRATLRRVLQTHVANRTLASVDILEEEARGERPQ